ncbi:pseudaminic acid cytidylyltransferase [Alphaproteobacteria bacterium]|nr:pseudaminic acid cytidylyltransferase [Alphaproteobacteria bacterium]
MIVAVIPARGGSKRIPKKNIKMFLGKPIIAYSIEAALKSNLFDRVIVSTDDDEIQEISMRYGASAPFKRPSHLSDDHTGTNEVVRHAINWLDGSNDKVNYACAIYATAPFINTSYLNEGFEAISSGLYDFAFSVTSYDFPVQRALVNRSGAINAVFPDHINSRSQDLEETFHDAGQFYWGTFEAFIESRCLFHERSFPVYIPRYLTQDIDTLEDWQLAESLYKATVLQQ